MNRLRLVGAIFIYLRRQQYICAGFRSEVTLRGGWGVAVGKGLLGWFMGKQGVERWDHFAVKCVIS